MVITANPERRIFLPSAIISAIALAANNVGMLNYWNSLRNRYALLSEIDYDCLDFKGTQMKWPKSAGKTIEEYLDATASRLDRRAFDAALKQYLSDQGPGITLDEKEMETLFEISDDFLRQRGAADAMKKAKVTLDWRKRTQLMERLTRRLGSVRESLERNPGRELPLTTLLVKSMRSKVGAILRELDSIAELQRSEKFMFAVFRKSSERELDYVWQLDAFLRYVLPTLRAQKRNLVIAGTLIAAGLRSDDDPNKDIAGAIPMARSRALRELMGEEMVTPWLNKWIPRPGTHAPTGYPKSVENAIDRQAVPRLVSNHQRPPDDNVKMAK